ncbi:MAG: AbrB/MazE/SpoVT family DNA-binding domain-containing protein [Caulobacter sp.]|nr:AbrB/MazE/SpoVT family DNA-binding domain-containing protein [Caulobacter sp.]
MSIERRVSLFRNGRNQAVRIPRDLELPGDEAILCKEGDQLILKPVAATGLTALLASWEPIEEDFDFGEDLPADPIDL